MLRQHSLAEAAQARAHVTNGVMIAANDLNARGVSAVAGAHGEFQFRIDEPVERRFVGKVTAGGC